ncbi:hypothetical protein ACFWWT_18695 [Streptomyces sp. NPDC058676]|uniref:hypothetical protein n=1 Tax=unclassified Streptomyces TaxID=2593676 RepID=UPI00365A137F
MTTGWQFRVDRGGAFTAREPVEAVRTGTTVATTGDVLVVATPAAEARALRHPTPIKQE